MANQMKTIVCLANSKKNGGRCIAGKEWDGEQAGDWIRPVSNRRGEELLKSWLDGKGGSPTLLDTIKMSLQGSTANEHQPENWLYDETDKWRYPDRFRWDELHKLADPVAHLWGAGHSSKYGLNDKIDPREKVNGSLRLVKVSGLQISVFGYWAGYANRKRQVRARFTYNNQEYGLKVTDVEREKELMKMGDGEYEIGECYLTISIVGPYDNYDAKDKTRYGLVAAIIKPQK